MTGAGFTGSGAGGICRSWLPASTGGCAAALWLAASKAAVTSEYLNISPLPDAADEKQAGFRPQQAEEAGQSDRGVFHWMGADLGTARLTTELSELIT